MPGIVKCGGTEGGIVVAHSCRKTKKLICGTEGEIVVAHGRLPSPASVRGHIKYTELSQFLKFYFLLFSIYERRSVERDVELKNKRTASAQALDRNNEGRAHQNI